MKSSKQRIAMSLFQFLAASLMTSIVGAADLSVKIDSLKPDKGLVRVGLFNAAADFPKKQLQGEAMDVKQGVVTVVFKNLPAGTYAVSAFQDVNDNKKLDTNAFGKPNEPYGFSRDAHGMFGPPSFEDAAFSVKEGVNAIEFKLK
ncbi:DUF2141 domain-containing protein [Sulfuritalea sp.]|uniref:DUF2141 domain-containing protein n=1 Tax=Sulfuritalea sp. TaxID=2480090 RepID=UPI00286E5E5D|nr:DUF2141 domain-containing protein [Sulfuritalea sp.]